MNVETIQMAVDKKYTAFSDAIKTELYNKMTNHPVSKQYADEFDKIQQMKQMFGAIGSTEE